MSVGNVRLQMLSKEARKNLQKYEHAVIFLMVFVTLTSIVWSISIHILSGDFSHGIFGAKLAFQERDFEEMNDRAKEIHNRDLIQIINEAYSDVILEAQIKTTSNETRPKSMQFPETVVNVDESTTVKATKKRKISHLFQTNSGVQQFDIIDDDDDDDNTTAVQAVKFDYIADQKFLANMTVDMQHTHWSHNVAVQFIYSFPFLSEIVAIIWTAMCLVFQSGVKKYWGLPKPWQIVIPSIIIFALMTLLTLTYTIMATGYLKSFCKDLQGNLTNSNVISCGQAITILRPLIRQHEFKHDVYLSIFRASYIVALIVWFVAFLVMLLRYIFAVDFQLGNAEHYSDNKSNQTVNNCKKPEFTEVLLNPPQLNTTLFPTERRHKSEDDFHSAKSQLSEVATPLLVDTPQKMV